MTVNRFGYGRVSTSDQSSDSQRDALLKAGVDRLFIETFTGTKSSRPELSRMMDLLRQGDTIVVTRLDRLGRSAKDLLTLAGELESRGVNLLVLEQNVNTSSPEGKLFFTLIASFAEFERDIMRARTVDGLAAARARGRVGGRRPSLTFAKVSVAKQLYLEGKPVSEIAEILGVSRPTIYRALETPRA